MKCEFTPFIMCPMASEDIPQVSEIEKEAFPTQWPLPSYRNELKNRLAYYFVLAEKESEPGVLPGQDVQIVRNDNFSPFSGTSNEGFLTKIISFFKSSHSKNNGNNGFKERKVFGVVGFWLMIDEAHITTIALRTSHRGFGLGELLLVNIVEHAMKLHASVVTLEVRVSNLGAQSLYEKYGFQKVGMRKNYYTDNGEDAYIMTTDNINSDKFLSKFSSLELKLTDRLRREESLPKSTLFLGSISNG